MIDFLTLCEKSTTQRKVNYYVIVFIFGVDIMTMSIMGEKRDYRTLKRRKLYFKRWKWIIGWKKTKEVLGRL